MIFFQPIFHKDSEEFYCVCLNVTENIVETYVDGGNPLPIIIAVAISIGFVLALLTWLMVSRRQRKSET